MRRDRFGLQSHERHPESLIGDLARHIRACGHGPDTEKARADIADALASKWWGIRVLAIQAIGRWNTEADRAWLVERARRLSPTAAELRNTSPGDDLRWRAQEIEEARRVLFRRVPRPEDSQWLLDLWFLEQGKRLWSAPLGGIPEEQIGRRIAAEIRGGDPERLQRVVLLLACRPGLPGRVEILRHLSVGTDEAAAAAAGRILDRIPRDAGHP